MKLKNASRYDEIEQEVADLYEECTNAVSLPLDLLIICKINHYILKPYSSLSRDELEDALDESEDGFTKIIEVNGVFRYCIFYNDSLCDARIRFTIAHEIGHIRLGHLDENILPYKIAEAEANYFAKYLLSPHPVSNKLQLASPAEFAETYHISNQAAEYTFTSYRKRIMYGSCYFEDHEVTILEAFGMV